MTFDHPARGSCVPGCALWGVCHCGCGETAPIPDQSRTRQGYVIGHPAVFRHGHYARWAHVRPPAANRPWSRRGALIDREAVRRLYERAGTLEAAGAAIGRSGPWVYQAMHGAVVNTTREVAQRIREALEADDIPKREQWIIPAERVRPLVEWLVGRYDTMRDVDRILGLGLDWTSAFLKGKRNGSVRSSTARRVVEVVQAHRHVPAASRSVWDVERRVLPVDELEHMRRREGRREGHRKGAA